MQVASPLAAWSPFTSGNRLSRRETNKLESSTLDAASTAVGCIRTKELQCWPGLSVWSALLPRGEGVLPVLPGALSLVWVSWPQDVGFNGSVSTLGCPRYPAAV